MGLPQTAGVAEGVPARCFTNLCRPRVFRLLLLVVVALLLFGQLSINTLFYRTPESLFYVNTTTPPSSVLFDSRFWWANSRLPWLQPVPVGQPKTTSSSTFNHSKSELERRENVTAENENKGHQINETKVSNVTNAKLEKKVDLIKLPTAANGTKNSAASSSTRPPPPPLPQPPPSLPLAPGINIPVIYESNYNLCPPVPPKLVGAVKVKKSAPTLKEQERVHPELAPGGHFRPENCTARHKVAIIIPYRDRERHLAVFLNHIHPILQRQQVDYAIFVVEQAGSGKFNRAMLMNVGALESLKHYPFQCFIFHDVDLLMEDDRNLYTCPEQPRHMSIAIDTMKYKLPYNAIFGGVSAMTVEQFLTVNGFSNKFWGWGGEDDDMSNRIKHYGFFISRYPSNVGRYTMLTHKKDNPNPRRYQYLNEGKKRYKSDGLNSVKYNVLDTQLRRLYTWLYVDLFPS